MEENNVDLSHFNTLRDKMTTANMIFYIEAMTWIETLFEDFYKNHENELFPFIETEVNQATFTYLNSVSANEIENRLNDLKDNNYTAIKNEKILNYYLNIIKVNFSFIINAVSSEWKEYLLTCIELYIENKDSDEFVTMIGKMFAVESDDDSDESSSDESSSDDD